MSNLDKIRKLERSARELKAKSDKLLNSSTFSYAEQELIRRILKAVFTQITNLSDKLTAKEILNKTEWLDNEL